MYDATDFQVQYNDHWRQMALVALAARLAPTVIQSRTA